MEPSSAWLAVVHWAVWGVVTTLSVRVEAVPPVAGVSARAPLPFRLCRGPAAAALFAAELSPWGGVVESGTEIWGVMAALTVQSE